MIPPTFYGMLHDMVIPVPVDEWVKMTDDEKVDALVADGVYDRKTAEFLVNPPPGSPPID